MEVGFYRNGALSCRQINKIITMSNGDRYEGETLNNEPHGKGTLTGANAEYVYEGDFVLGKPTGKGKVTFKNGNVYEGDFLNNLFHGFGTLTTHDGEYVGQWLNHERHGVGTANWKNGNWYHGEWQKNLMHGQGTRYKKNRFCYQGQLQNGDPSGFGRITFFASGRTYEGKFAHGCLYGNGSLISPPPLLSSQNRSLALLEHLECAQYGIEQCQLRYPLGAMNQKTIYDAMFRDPTFKEQLNVVAKYAGYLKILMEGKRALTADEISEKNETVKPMQGFTCCESAFLTRDILLTKYPHLHVEVVQLHAHYLLVIGRPPDSDPADIGTWGDAAMCDAWAQAAYPACDFDEVRTTLPNIDFYSLQCYRFACVAQAGTQHYSYGNPVVVFPVASV
jgi:hypothetical protein